MTRSWVLPNTIGGKFTVQPLPVHFAWARAGSQPEVRNAFDVTALPTIVGVNVRKSLYLPFTGAFTEDAIHSFVFSVLDNKEPLQELDLPRFR